MKHIKTFDQVNEGIIDSIKELIFPSIYRVSFKVTHKREGAQKSGGDTVKTKDKKETREAFKPQHKLIDIKAKSEEIAEDKFHEMLSKQLAGLEPKPEIEIISIHKVKKAEHKSIKF